MNYVIYHLGKIMGIYKGNSPPNIPNLDLLIISDADAAMCQESQDDFLVIGEKLVMNYNIDFNIRKKRDFLLNDSDKYTKSDFPIKDISREEWSSRVLTYRQELRDFPSVYNKSNIVWPVLLKGGE